MIERHYLLSEGGRLILYMNNRWCNPSHLIVKDPLCCCDLELLAVSMRPYYLPRAFTQVIAVCVYIPPRADAGAACEIIHATCMSGARLQTHYPEALFVISGDFNHVTLTSTLTGFHQFLDCPECKNRTIDLMYANAKRGIQSIRSSKTAHNNPLHQEVEKGG